MKTDIENKAFIKNETPLEFQYLENLIAFRLGYGKRPSFPDIYQWSSHLKNYILNSHLTDQEDAICLLLIALAPHAIPELFDRAIQEKIKTSGDFPEIGGVRGKNFRGFLPTGQTAVFLLANDDREKQMEIEQLFWSDREFYRKKILWLEELPQGEPVMSGKIIMALDYVSQFLFGTSAPPHFSTSFPAKRIKTMLGSGDIMMNNEIIRHFRNLKEWIDFNPRLMDEWDMKKRLRQGYRVLFYGPAGTGKTLTATVLGNETSKEVYKIDLSMVVSKYIGETEKNLELLFARAEDKDWILFFDEADAIFGKRTSVKDAHDKYANQEVSYLLQRIEEFNGLVILATNMKNNIDDAFIRRFNDIVKFSIPNEEERKEIWVKSFPENSDYGDIPDKVKKYELTGGNIINVIHFAGIQAVKRHGSKSNQQTVVISSDNNINPGTEKTGPGKLVFYLDDIIEGIRREMNKEGKPFSL
jgi:ATPase family associated with various cellular activities (AAA)